MSVMGERVRAARRAKGLTAGELASAVGISKMQIYKIEWGTRGTTYERLRSIARVLHVTVDWVVGQSDEGGPGRAQRARQKEPS